MTGERNLTCHGGHDRGDAAVVRVAALPLSGTIMPSITCNCKYNGKLNEVEQFVNALISLRTSTQREMRGADQAPGTGGLINNNNDYEMDDMHEHEFSTRTEELRQSERDALTQRYNKSHVPRVGFMPQPRPHGVFRWMYCQVNGLAGDQEPRETK